MPIIREVRPKTVVMALTSLALLACFVAAASLMTGAMFFSAPFVFSTLYHAIVSPELLARSPETTVLLDIRLPRVLLALFTGGGLAVAGVVFQVLLRNVLADPYILGISGGASVGALVAIITGFSAVSIFALPAAAFVGAVAVALLVMTINLRPRMRDGNTLLLCGVMAGAFFSSIILVLITTMGAPLREALYWLVGNLSNATSVGVSVVALVCIPILLVLFFSSRMFNALVLGRETASLLGVRFQRTTFGFYLLASMLTAVVVSFTGLIGFVGFAVPHATRMIFGTDHRIALPASFFVGAIFLMISDLLARTIVYPTELPVGAITAALGAPLFIAIIARKR